jgi:hypothetical protein
MHRVLVIQIVVVNIHLIIIRQNHLINVKKVFVEAFIRAENIEFWFCLDCNCTGFSAPFTCTCGESANKHITLVETKDEREKRGHPTGYATPYQAMGGLTGFSSLAEGYLRLDPSGRGRKENSFSYKKISILNRSTG